MNKLALKSSLGLANLAVLLGLALFLTAGTLHWVQAWCWLALFFGGCILITVYIYRNDKALLLSRLKAGPAAEQRTRQKILQGIASLGFAALFIVPGFDRRFRWSEVPAGLVITALGFVAVSMVLFFIVYRANSFLSATVEVQGGQRVVSDGPYAVVRHPMYSAALLLFLATPLALGSWSALLALPVLTLALALRALDEEALLRVELQGYDDYCRKVRFRLVPYIW